MNNIDRIKTIIDRREQRLVNFGQGEGYIPIICMYQNAKQKLLCLVLDLDQKKMLENQLMIIEDLIETSEDYLPFLCPWYGCGLYAEMYGCKTDYFSDKEPWTHPVVKTAAEADKLEPPDIGKSPMAKKVLTMIDYFLDKTHGKIPIALTDTQAPLDTAMLVWEQSDFFLAFYEAKDVLNRLLKEITQMIVAFSKKQISLIGKENTCCPGMHMLSQKGGTVLDVADDILALISTDNAQEYDKPFIENIAEAMGGIAVHSCGKIDQHFEFLAQYAGLKQLNCKINPSEPNSPEILRDCFKNTNIVIHLILDMGFEQNWSKYGANSYLEYITDYVLPRLHHNDLKYAISFQAFDKTEAQQMTMKIREKIKRLQF